MKRVTFFGRYRFLLIPLAAAVMVIAVVLYLTQVRQGHVISDSEKWTIKQKETFSRLLRVPIVLYHEIDGKGPFAVSLDTLRSHFQYFKDNDVTVVPLSDLLDRLENPRPYKGKVIVITFDDGYKNMYKKLLPLAKEYNYPVTLFVYTDFISEKGKKSITWNELREMQKNGIDIQCHTQSHKDLVKLISKRSDKTNQILFKELYLSRKRIEMMLHKPVDLLAFPFGYYDLSTIRYATYAGYRKVFSTDEGSNPLPYNNYCLRRHHIKRNYTLDKLSQIIELNFN